MVGGGQGAMPPILSKSSNIRKLYCLFGNFWTFAVGKGKGFEFYWKIFELGLPTLQVP